MFAVLYTDGHRIDCPDPDDIGSVSLEFDYDAPTHRCAACGDPLIESADGHETAQGDSRCLFSEPTTDADDEDGPDVGDGPHDPERVPVSWCNGAAITIDEGGDAVTVSISVGDPRGAFTFTVRRIPDDVDSELAGRLIMHTPHPGEPLPHEPLSEIRPGTYLVGVPMPAMVRPAPITNAA